MDSFGAFMLNRNLILRCQCLPEKVKPVRSSKTVRLTETLIRVLFLDTFFIVYYNVKGLLSI